MPGNLAGALERVAGTMRAVLTRTHSQGAVGTGLFLAFLLLSIDDILLLSRRRVTLCPWKARD